MNQGNRKQWHEIMKEFQLEQLMRILDKFYFLIHENYSIKDVTIGLRAYPYVSFKNHQLNMTVEISGADLGCEGQQYRVCITKRKFFSFKVLSVTTLMEKSGQANDIISISEYARYIQQHLMPVIRGERWI